MFKDETGEIVPAIVSEELWESANVVLRRRSEDVKNRQGICNHANLLTGKLFCSNCDAPYHRRESKDKEGNKNSKWVCSNKINSGKDVCASFPIYEEEIKPVLFEVFKDTKDSSAAMMFEYEKLYLSMTANDNLDKMIAKQEGIIDLANKKKGALLKLIAEGNINGKDFKDMTESCNKEIHDAEVELAELKSQQESSEEFKKHMEKVRAVLKAAERDIENGEISKDFIDTFIDKIFVTPLEDKTMEIRIKIFTGETTERYLKKLKGRECIIIPPSDRTAESAENGAKTGDFDTKSWGSDTQSRTGHTIKMMIYVEKNLYD